MPDRDVPHLKTFYNHISQDEVIRAIGRMKARRALPVIRIETTDTGCEFLDQKRLDRPFKAETYDTRAYAPYEKGSIENYNRLVRRWYPKGTNFNRLTRHQIQQLEGWINSILCRWLVFGFAAFAVAYMIGFVTVGVNLPMCGGTVGIGSAARYDEKKMEFITWCIANRESRGVTLF